MPFIITCEHSPVNIGNCNKIKTGNRKLQRKRKLHGKIARKGEYRKLQQNKNEKTWINLQSKRGLPVKANLFCTFFMITFSISLSK